MTLLRGRAELLGMLERGELSQVTADLTLAQRLIESAKRHLKSAGKLGEDDPELAYAANAVRAQFGASMGALLRPIDRIRATRHAVDTSMRRPGSTPMPSTQIYRKPRRSSMPRKPRSAI